MEDMFSRSKMLIGDAQVELLSNKKVAVFGIGGVGGFTMEALCRSGIGTLALFDSDVVSVSNLNRQIIATNNSVGKDKVSVAKQRLLSINPNIRVDCYNIFYSMENANQFDLINYDYIVDAIDSVSSKILLIENAKKSGVPIISCMGTGGKMDISRLKVADISKTSGCPLARVMRRELRARNIQDLKVVYSDEEMITNSQIESVKADGRRAPASMIFVPAVAGLMLANQVVKDLIGLN